ncbi:restriction endonuclease subunit S [Rhizobium ecuadorense]|uniref:restriction endonuclease subunit S n=1 Tax=Rhizobium ecuadorense TaxID=1671795 RepID=UPI00067388D9|nr:restriction endonuclease subunit S [Rhizobium ecuadorense]
MSWQSVALDEVATIERTAIDPTSLDGETPYVGLEHIESGGRLLDIKPVSNGELKSTKFAFGTKHILYGKLRPYLAKIALPEFEGICSTDILPILPGPNLDRNYLGHFLRQPSMIDFAASRSEGANLPRLSPKALAKFEIPLPPLTEQRRIAAILDKADQLRQKRRQAIALLDSLTQSIFLDMFGDVVSNPMGWETQTVENFCELIVDCVNRTAPLAERSTDFKMIRTTNVKNGRLLLSEVRYVDEETFTKWNRRATPQIGDVILTREAPVGEVGILDVPGNFFLGQRLMLYRPDRKKMTSEYMLRSFQSKFLSEQFRQGSSGSTVKHLPLPACRSFAFRVPPIEIQQQFSKRVASIKRSLGAIEVMTLRMDEVFSSFQHRAFSGQL